MKKLWVIIFLAGIMSFAQSFAQGALTRTLRLKNAIEFELSDGTKVHANAVRVSDMYGPSDSRSNVVLGDLTSYGFKPKSSTLHGESKGLKPGYLAVWTNYADYQESDMYGSKHGQVLRLFILNFNKQSIIFTGGKEITGEVYE